MRYKDHKLGTNVEDVLGAFYNHQGEADKKPFGRDVHQGFEFFLHTDGRLYKKEPGVMIQLTLSEETEMRDNLARGAVELYLRRPTSGLPPYPQVEKVILHAATGMPIPYEEDEPSMEGIVSYCQQICGQLGSAMCGTGKICHLGVNRETELPAAH